ncbi:MAG: GAF domain-containing sensor histidine kinase, partial [Chloroflexi bacterium]|nr:GAF domain-containing sensor histidine kinase [Chloroflexota bacterium]
LALTKLRAGWIVLRDHRENNNPLASRGLPQEAALAHVECAWSRPVCSEVLALVESKVVPNTLEYPCPVSEFLRQEGLSFRVCVPLQSKERVLGVMTLFGDIPGGAQEFAEDALEMLTSIGRQIGVAIENARLYDELRQQEGLHRQLLDRLITVQEEERRRIARELHDQTGQSLTSLIMVLKLLEEADSSVPIRPYIEEARDMAVQILRGVRDLALQLRPSALDDLGLLAAFRHYFRRYETRFRLPVDFQVLGVSQERLPPDVETALYRIMQEALTNVARHAQATNVSVLLEMRKGRVKLIIEDDGQGFDVARVMGSRAHERNLGLYGMRERATLVGGMFTIESTPGVGTTVFVEIPLGEGGPS